MFENKRMREKYIVLTITKSQSSYKIDFKTEIVRDKGRHFIMIQHIITVKNIKDF
jgi:hypothetical protein